MATILQVKEGVVRKESRPVQTRDGEVPRVKTYVDLASGEIVAVFTDADRAPAAGTTVIVEQVTGERDDGSVWTSWQIG